MANLINEQIIEERVKKCIKQIYEEVPSLFLRNNGRGLCEKCLVFRFAFYLQKKFPKYFVDCDFNSEYWSYLDNSGNIISGENTRKSIMNEDGTFTKRFIDIIIHDRKNPETNFICFEIKKSNNRDSNAYEKDIQNLRLLTGENFKYKFGFHIIFNKTYEKTRMIVFKNGDEIIR